MKIELPINLPDLAITGGGVVAKKKSRFDKSTILALTLLTLLLIGGADRKPGTERPRER